MITELCQEVLRAGVRLLGVQIGAVLELLPERDALAFRAVHGMPDSPTKRAIPDAPSISMSANLSAVQFRNQNLPETVADALRGASLDPSCLSLELTESVMVDYADSLMETLESLKALGVRVVLDDFGTGYSSLAYLTPLPLDALKVDRSFIDGLGTEPRDTAVTEAIVAMAHALSLEVVGEGTDTELQVTELTRLGCDIAPGYHFSRPLPPAEITRMLQGGPARLGPGA